MYGILFQARKHIIATNEYFEERNLIVLEIRNPDASDWLNNPFKESNRSWPSNIFWFVNFDTTYRDHKIIVVANKNKTGIHIYWRQVKTEGLFFRTSSIHFLKSKKLNKLDKKKFAQSIVKVLDQCPACGNEIKTSDKECPDCRINFE